MEEQALVTTAMEDPAALIAHVTAALPDANDPVERSRLLRAQAIAERNIGQVDEAVASATDAIAEAERADARREQGLAWGTLGTARMASGDFEAAEAALETGCGLVDGRDRLELDAQLAGLWARQGDAERALVGLAGVADAAGQLGEVEMAADAWANRGTLLAFIGRLDEAIADLEAARSSYRQLDQFIGAAQMTHNLGWVAGLRGDFQRSLDLFEAADGDLAGHDFWADTIRLLDRAEAELHAGLYTDAARDAREAAARNASVGAHTDQAEALLVAAQAHLAGGALLDARDAADEARLLFEIQGRPGWAAEAELVAARCQPEPDIDSLVDLAQRFEDAGQPRSALTARLLAGGAGRFDLLGDVVREDLTASHRVLFDQAQAAQLIDAADTAGALSLIRATLAETAAERAAIASTDVRAALSGAVSELRQTAAHLVRDDAIQLFEFAEWGSLIAAEPPPVAASEDPELTQAATELRQMSSAVRAAEREFEDTTEMAAELRRLERQVTDRYRRGRREGIAGPVTPTTPFDVAGALGSIGLTRFCTLGGRCLRIDVINGTPPAVVDIGASSVLGPLAREFADSVERGLQVGGSERAAAIAAGRLDQAGRDLDAALFAGGLTGPLAVLTDAAFAGVPWRMLPSRRGESTVVMATAALALRPHRPAGTPLRVTALLGPALDHADTEASAVAALYQNGPDTTTPTTVEQVVSSLAGVDVAHIASHAHLRPDQPLLSSVELYCGPVTVADLQQIQPAPRVVVLASCSSGRELALDGPELVGLASALATAGSDFVVASPVVLQDSPVTTAAMVALHRRLASGLDPDAALRAARADVDDDALAVLDAMVVFGAPARSEPERP